MTKSELLRSLFIKYDLVFDEENPDSRDNDVYIHKHYKIITRTGIEKIKRACGITVHYVHISSSPAHCYLHVTGSMDGAEEATFASANADTTSNGYYPEMAEKRGMSRVVLKLAGLYEQGVYGQDEAEDFDRDKIKTATYKGGK